MLLAYIFFSISIFLIVMVFVFLLIPSVNEFADSLAKFGVGREQDMMVVLCDN